MPPRSWTSSIARFALAVLLVAVALQYLHDVLTRTWPALLAVLLIGAAGTAGVTLFRRRDYW